MANMGRDNLFHPVMYLIDKNVKRHFNAMEGGPTGDGGKSADGGYIEGVKLNRDNKGRLVHVEGWEYLDYHLTYDKNILSYVDVIHRLTGKHLRITLLFDDKNLLVEVEPELLDPGTGEPGQINIPSVTEDYNDI